MSVPRSNRATPYRLTCPTGPYGWRALGLTAALFFIIGFVTWLNGPLISFVQVGFALDDASAFLLPLVFYISYVLFALPCTRILARTGLRRGLSCALLIMAAGMAATGQAMHAGSYHAALAGFLVLGGGLALLQVAITPYVSLLGPPERGAQRIAMMGLCNKLGGVVAPVVLAMLAMRHTAALSARLATESNPATRALLRQQGLDAIHAPALGMAALLAATSLWLRLSPLPDITPATTRHRAGPWAACTPRALLGACAMFLYVGVEVLAGDAIGTYARDLGISLNQTRFFTSLTLLCMLGGYLAGLLLCPRVLTQEKLLLLSCGMGAGTGLLALGTQGYASVLCISLLGFANAMIFPALFPLALRGAGQATVGVSALLVMAYCGGGILPQCFIWLKPILGFQPAFVLPVLLSYALIAAYAAWFGRAERPAPPFLQQVPPP